MKRHLMSAAVAGCLVLSGCGASPQTTANLNDARYNCSQGNLPACNSIPYVQEAANREASANLALLLLIPLLPILIFAHR